MNYIKISCFVFFHFLFFIEAAVIDHLKTAERKSDGHNMPNIDFIYMINLDQRPEKFALASQQLHSYGIYPYRFSAVNGWDLPLDVINDIGLKYQIGMTPLMATTFPFEAKGRASYELMSEVGKTYFCHRMTKGALGCALSHISILKDALDSGYETIWVLEDDIEVIKDPRIISELINKLDDVLGKENWDVLFTDQNYRKNPEEYLIASGAAKRPDLNCQIEERYSEKFTVNYEISLDFRKISARFGTHSMIIRRSGMKKLLEFSRTHQIYLPYDLENYLIPEIQRYSFTYDIVTNMLHAITDNADPAYMKSK